MKKIQHCLVDSGYKELQNTLKNDHLVTDYRFFGCEKTTWVQLSRGKKNRLLRTGRTGLSCKCPVAMCAATSQDTACKTVLTLAETVPCFEKGGMLVHENSYQHEIKHWYCVVKFLMKGKWHFVSLYAYNKAGFLDFVRTSSTVWVGILVAGSH